MKPPKFVKRALTPYSENDENVKEVPPLVDVYRFSVDFVAAATTTTFQQLIANNNQFD